MKHITRIYTEQKLFENATVRIDAETTHHLLHVLRTEDKESIRVFNAECGEWCAICNIRKKDVIIICTTQIKVPVKEPGFTVIFALIVPAKMHVILEKATELGAAQFRPIITEYTQNRAFNIEKAKTIIRNAVEQCGRLSMPSIYSPVMLPNLLASWPNALPIIVGDRCDNRDITILKYDASFLIGPEGGFSSSERELFAIYEFVKRIQISNNVLRSETAAVAFSALCGAI